MACLSVQYICVLLGSSPVFKANIRSSNSCDSSSAVTRLVLMKPPSVVYVPITGLGLNTLLGWLLGRSDARSQSADTWNTQVHIYGHMSTQHAHRRCIEWGEKIDTALYRDIFRGNTVSLHRRQVSIHYYICVGQFVCLTITILQQFIWSEMKCIFFR